MRRIVFLPAAVLSTVLAAVLGLGVVVTTASPAWAEKKTEVSKCVEEKAANHEQADTCLKAPNPILPATNELVWGSLAFVVLFGIMAKLAYPQVKKMMDERTERIRRDLDDAERVKGEAQSVLADYQRQLADARNEANRIIEESRQTAEQLRRDLMQRAEAEVTDLRQRSREEIQAAQERAMAELQDRVKDLVIDLAEKVVEHNLDRETNMALIENYISQVGSRS
jgi:F-type H+-transporting ATPase subunit b